MILYIHRKEIDIMKNIKIRKKVLFSKKYAEKFKEVWELFYEFEDEGIECVDCPFKNLCDECELSLCNVFEELNEIVQNNVAKD